MPKFEGCLEGQEISFTRKGSNQHTAVLLHKSVRQLQRSAPAGDPAPTPSAEPETMDISTAKALLGMNDVTKSHFLALPDAEAVAFLALDAATQASTAQVAKSAADEADRARVIAETGKSAYVLDLEKRVALQGAEIELLKGDKIDVAVAKRAAAEFSGYPGGEQVVIPLLKAYAKLPDAERIASEDILKAHITLAKSAGATYGRTPDQMATLAPAHTEVVAKAMVPVEAKDEIAD